MALKQQIEEGEDIEIENVEGNSENIEENVSSHKKVQVDIRPQQRTRSHQTDPRLLNKKCRTVETQTDPNITFVSPLMSTCLSDSEDEECYKSEGDEGAESSDLYIPTADSDHECEDGQGEIQIAAEELRK
jgi:hypothetical protein